MRKTTKLNILVLTFFILFLLLGNTSFALTGKVNSADYTVCIKEDGSVDVIEIIDLSLEKDIDNFSKRFDENIEIKNLAVKEYNKDGEVKIEYEKMNNKNELKVNSFSFEENILNIKIDKNVRKYLSISYSFENKINIYTECAELDLVLQENDFDYFSGEITGKVQFENKGVNLNDIYVWGHAENDVIIKRVNEFNQINFILDEKEENQKFDIKVVFPKEIIKIDNLEIVNDDKTLEEIIEKENDIINIKELKTQSEILNIRLVNIIIIMLFIILVIIISILIIRKKTKKDSDDNKADKREESAEIENNG